MIRWIRDPLLEVGGPVLHWIGPETLVDLTIEGRNVNALADSGSQVNTITPTLVQQYGFPVLPLEDLVDYPLNLVGLGGKRTSPLHFVRIINVIWESEIDCLSMPWATARMVQLFSCQKSTAVLTLGSAEAQSEGASRGAPEVEVDELVMVGESLHLGPFQTEIIAGQVKPPLRDTAHIMITPLRAEGQLWGARPLPPGLHVLHAYTCLKNGSGKVSLIVRNISDSYIFLKKGVPVV